MEIGLLRRLSESWVGVKFAMAFFAGTLGTLAQRESVYLIHMSHRPTDRLSIRPS